MIRNNAIQITAYQILVLCLMISSCAGLSSRNYQTKEECVIQEMDGRNILLIDEIRKECARKFSGQKNKTNPPAKIKFGNKDYDSDENPHPPGSLDYQIWEDNNYYKK
ncbi:MAG: hypothetical protein OEY59_07820 [Deltaproteobacteria bacterium]|nr:hypothetical protein [Deltaproteobacteria bacterium]